MTLKTIRFASLFLTALTLGMAFCHALEFAGKVKLAAPVWLEVQHTLYGGFGTVGAAIEVGSILSTWLAVARLRRRRPAFARTLAAALVMTAALAVWVLVVAPVNAPIAAWTSETLPADWTAYRNRWETGHAIHAALYAVALGLLLAAVLGETPAGGTAPPAPAAESVRGPAGRGRTPAARPPRTPTGTA